MTNGEAQPDPIELAVIASVPTVAMASCRAKGRRVTGGTELH